MILVYNMYQRRVNFGWLDVEDADAGVIISRNWWFQFQVLLCHSYDQYNVEILMIS